MIYAYKFWGIINISLAVLTLLFGAASLIAPRLFGKILRKNIVLSRRNILLRGSLLFSLFFSIGGSLAVLYRSPEEAFFFKFIGFFSLSLAIFSLIFGMISLFSPAFLAWLLRKVTHYHRGIILIATLLFPLLFFSITLLAGFLDKYPHL
jgi:hypothetical protein